MNKMGQERKQQRKKHNHRSKVETEGKPPRKESTPTPKPTESKVTPTPTATGKRKYVRKKGLNPNNGPTTPLPKATIEGGSIKSCRKALKFDTDRAQDGSSSSTSSRLNHNNTDGKDTCEKKRSRSQSCVGGLLASLNGSVDFMQPGFSASQASDTEVSVAGGRTMLAGKKPRKNAVHGHQGILAKPESPINNAVKQSKCLDIYSPKMITFTNPELHTLVPHSLGNQESNAQLLYGRDGTVVRFEGPSDPTRNPRPRPVVDLDEETIRVWKLLLEDINSEGVDGTDEENTKWWEEERRIFRGRADSFVARMRLVQGDRPFSKWKGSVVDSVVGVFLTQNVSDHLSSSTFMSLAAQFPLKSKGSHGPCHDDTCTRVEGSDDTFYWNETFPNQPVRISRTRYSIEGHNVSSQKGFAMKSDTSKEKRGRVQKQRKASNQDTLSKEAETNRKKGFAATKSDTSNEKSLNVQKQNEKTNNWDTLRKEAHVNGKKRERTTNTMDSLDWEAVMSADVSEIANFIRERGMNNMIAERIKSFLNRLIEEHGSIDLEWLRDVPPDRAKEYLLSIRGLGLKSVECVRLLTLHHLAFPVDTNVGRIAVRLGWVPLQPLPGSLQLHQIKLYPPLETIQKYLWPRLCKLDLSTLFELHYHMITFGKIFCTKSKPNCNACPLRGECRHFARKVGEEPRTRTLSLPLDCTTLALPGPEEKSRVSKQKNTAKYDSSAGTIIPLSLPSPILQASQQVEAIPKIHICEPIFKEPLILEPECPLNSECDIEDAFYEVPNKFSTTKLDMEFTQNYMQNGMKLQEGDTSKALVFLTSDVPSLPVPKLKSISRQHTEHQVYELPNSHPLLKKMDKREPDDPCSYLLAIWTPGETPNSIRLPERRCDSQDSGIFCKDRTCFSCSSIKEARSQTVRGTILIPCRTALKGRFPLNGTYFQVNEVFADHESSLSPIDVPRSWLWNLPRRIVYFGTSISAIFKGLSTENIQNCFRSGYVCIRGFDVETRTPQPLIARLHFPVNKLIKQKNKWHDV